MEKLNYERSTGVPAVVATLLAAPVAPAPRPSSMSQPHQLWAQAEPALTIVPLTGINGTSGFMARGSDGARKRTDVRGVPPRGRPV